MSEANHPYGNAGNQGQAGGGLPSYGADQQGHGAGMPSYGTGQPGYGAPVDPSAPPTSASSAPQAPWSVAPSSSPAATSTAQVAPAMSAGQAGAVLRRLGIGNPLPTFAVGAFAYVVGLCAAVVVIVSAVLAALAADTGDLTGGGTMPTDSTGSSSGADGLRGIIALLGMPFQLVSLATFGSYGVDVNLGFLGSAELGWRGLPLLITVSIAAAGFLAARFVQRRWSSNGALGALLFSGISGLAVAIFAVIITRLTAFSFEEESMGMGISMHSAGADMFFGTWAVIAVPLFLGHVAGLEKPTWWPVVADLAAAPRLALVHALAFAVPVWLLLVVGGALGMLIEGEGGSVLSLFLSIPIWGPFALALLPGLGLLTVPVHVTVRGDVQEFGVERPDEFLWFFDLPWYVWIPMVLIGLVVPVLVALLWHRDREIPQGDVIAQVVSWAALPLAYFAGSLLLMLLVWTRASLEMGMLGDYHLAVGLGAWMPLVAFCLGLVVEVLARFGAPFADRFVPGVLVNWFRRSARTRRTAQTAAPAQTAPGQVPGSPYPPSA